MCFVVKIQSICPTLSSGAGALRHSVRVSSMAPSAVATTSGVSDSTSPGAPCRSRVAAESVSAHQTISRAGPTSVNAPGYGSVTARIRLKICREVCVHAMRPSSGLRPPK